MKHFHFLLAAVLSLVVTSTAYAQATLQVNITVSITVPVDITWADDTNGTRTWLVNGGTALALAGTDNTLALAGNGNIFDVKSASSVPIMAQIRISTSGTWIHKARTGFPAAADQFYIVASTNNADFTNAGSVELPDGTGSDVTLFAGPLAPAATKTVDFLIKVPSSLSAISKANPGTISLLITASAL